MVASAGGTRRLVSLGQLPAYLQFNPYVLRGYRPLMTWWECLASLTYLHNETVNILSHVVALVYALWCLPELLPWADLDMGVLPYCHAAALVAPWLGSSLYHLFMNHRSGSETYFRLLQWDVVGVWVTQACGGLTTVYVGTYCLPLVPRYLLLALYGWFSIGALHAAVCANSAWARRQSFASLFLLRMAVIALRMTTVGGGHPLAFKHVVLQDFLPLLGAVISATLVPERWLTGRLDFAFNSHNVMHVLVVIGGVHMHWAVKQDFKWLRNPTCPS